MNEWPDTAAKHERQQTSPEHYATDFLHLRVASDKVHYQTDDRDD
jgi:hypothetical protein